MKKPVVYSVQTQFIIYFKYLLAILMWNFLYLLTFKNHEASLKSTKTQKADSRKFVE